MRATIHLTHHRGIRRGEYRAHPRGKLKGELLTYTRVSKRGVLMVATLRDPNNHISEPLVELFDVTLYLTGPQALHLRGVKARVGSGRLAALRLNRNVLQNAGDRSLVLNFLIENAAKKMLGRRK